MRNTHLFISTFIFLLLSMGDTFAQYIKKFEVGYASTNYSLGAAPRDLHFGNLRGQDNFRDLITANFDDNTISVRLCNDDGTFAALTNYSVGPNPSSVRSGNLDGSGPEDVVVTHYGDNTISVLLNNGNGTLSTNDLFVVGSTGTPGPVAVAVGRADGDSRPDIVVANYLENSISILYSLGDGFFAPATNYSVGAGPSSILIRDISGDGVSDLLTANKDDGTLSLLTGIPAGTFNPVQTITLFPGGDPQPVHALSADFNGDGFMDIVTANNNSNSVSILLQDANGMFQISTNYQVGSSPRKLLVRDLNGDDASDIIVVNGGDNNIQVLLAVGDGTYTDGGTFAVGNNPEAIAGSNFNGDGVTDLAIVNSDDDDVSILLYDLPMPFSFTMDAFEDSQNFVHLRGRVATGRPLSFLLTVPPTNGTLSLTNEILDAPVTNLFYTGNTNVFGTDSFSYQVTDGISTSATAVVTINIENVNDLPSFDLLTNEVHVSAQGVLHTETGFAQNISAGPGEGFQNVSFIISTTNSSFFAVQPAINPAGDLSFVPSVSAAGTNEVTVSLRDDGNAPNQSAPQTFTIVLPVFPPVVDVGPANLTVLAGETATFSVTAGGVGPFSYQWNLESSPIPGATESSYTIEAASATNAGNYSVDISNSAGFTSAAAQLTVDPDSTAPTVKIVSPSSSVRLLAGPVTAVSGTAADNVRVGKVLYGLNGDSVTNEATLGGTATAATWNANVTMRAGTNVLVVKAADFSDNESSSQSVNFTYVVFEPVTLNVTGVGSLAGITNGQLLELEKSYKVTAIPGLNNVFSNWTGAVTSDVAKLTFTMQSNTVLTANFVENPLLSTHGIYSGLFYETNQVFHESSGFFRFKVKTNFAWSGYLLLDGDKVAVKGKFSLEGQDSVSVLRTRQNKKPLLVSLDLKLGTPDEQVVGTVTEVESLDPGAATNWTAALLGDRYVWSATNNATEWTNRYTMVLPPDTNNPASFGYGWGSIGINTNGYVTLIGNAGDGAPIKQKTVISKNGQWPLYVPLYSKKNQFFTNNIAIPPTIKTNKEFQGSLIGWVNFGTNETQAALHPSGNLSWIKQTGLDIASGTTDALYADGFTNALEVVGSRYLPPAPLTQAIDATNVTLLLEGGNLEATVSVSAPLSERNAIVLASTNNPDRVKLSITPKTGQFRGSFVGLVGGTNKTFKVFGAVLQDQNFGRGVFAGTNAAGRAVLDP